MAVENGTDVAVILFIVGCVVRYLSRIVVCHAVLFIPGRALLAQQVSTKMSGCV